MPEPLPNHTVVPQPVEEIHPVQTILRFLRIVRFRKGPMIVALVAAGLLGGLYYATAIPRYESKAEVEVIKTDVGNISLGGQVQSELSETSRRVLLGTKVIGDAVVRLKAEVLDWTKCLRLVFRAEGMVEEAFQQGLGREWLEAKTQLLDELPSVQLRSNLREVPLQQWPEAVEITLAADDAQRQKCQEIALRARDLARQAIQQGFQLQWLEMKTQLLEELPNDRLKSTLQSVPLDEWPVALKKKLHNEFRIGVLPADLKGVTSEQQLKDWERLLKSELLIDFAGIPPEKHADAILGNLTVSIPRRSRLLVVSCQSKSAVAAKVIVKHVLDAYVARMSKTHIGLLGTYIEGLNVKIDETENTIRAIQGKILKLKLVNPQVAIKDGVAGNNVYDWQAHQWNRKLFEAREQLSDAQELSWEARIIAEDFKQGKHSSMHLWELTLRMAKSKGGEQLSTWIEASRVNSQTISSITQTLHKDEALREKLSREGYLPGHSRVVEIETRIEIARRILQERRDQEGAKILQRSDGELIETLVSLADQQLKVADVHTRRVGEWYLYAEAEATRLCWVKSQLDTLESDLSRNQGLFDTWITQLSKIDFAPESGVRAEIVSSPRIRPAKVFPHAIVVGLLSLMLGLGSGLALVYVQDLLDDHFRSPEELQMQTGLPVLTMVRKLTPLVECGMDAIHVHVRPTAAESEAFRTLRTALALAKDGAERLVVSSSEPGDGKTTIVGNLATVYAQSGKRTLLIDADMRRPGLTPLLNLKGPRGLSAILRDKAPLAESVQANMHVALAENLDVIPSGPRPGNPTELLAGERFSELLSWAETNYDQILIDSPPALVSDTAIIGRLVDGVLLTVRPEKNQRKTVIRAAESFPLLGIKVLGIVINHVSSDQGEGYYGYSYGYGYGYGYGHEEDSPEVPDHSERLIRPARRDLKDAA